ncbi:MAG: hypothetical protein R2838_25850 [Caldilineaceae bacterium]
MLHPVFGGDLRRSCAGCNCAAGAGRDRLPATSTRSSSAGPRWRWRSSALCGPIAAGCVSGSGRP